jgi:hypothetical protein
VTDPQAPRHSSFRPSPIALDGRAPSRLQISSLIAADSPRLDGENGQHVAMLSQSGAQLPPILVNRATLRVVDGMHRLRAAQRNGQTEIEVVFFDGDDDATFVMAVRANVTHGMPLTRADRSAAATRIVATYPYWSDRRIAEATGLSPKTVGAIRNRSLADVTSAVRIGRDGKARSMPSATRDLRAAASSSAGCAQPNVQNWSGVEESVASEDGIGSEPGLHRSPPDPAAILWSLRRDPALRFTEMGRIVLRMLSHSESIPRAELDILIDAVPAHCVERIADLARQYSSLWLELARRLDQEAATQCAPSTFEARSS